MPPSSQARGAALQFAAQLLVTLAGYVTALVLGRALGPVAFGAYSMVYSALLATEVVGRLGVPQALTKLVAERSDGRASLETTGLGLGAAVYLLLFVGFWSAGPGMARGLHVTGGAWLFRVAALDIPFYGLLFVVIGVLNGRGRYERAAAATAVYAIAKILGVLGIALGGATIVGALIVNSASSALGLAAACLGSGLLRAGPDRASLRRILHLALPLSFRGVAAQLLISLGLWSLGIGGALVSDEARGLFAAASSIARLPTVLALGVTGVVVGSIAAANGRGDHAAARAALAGVARGMLVLLFPATVLLAIEGREVMVLLFDPTYAAGGRLLGILVVGQGFAFTFLVVLTSALVAVSQLRAALAASFGGLAVAAIGLAMLVPPLGAPGAAIATTLGCLVGAAWAGLAAWRAVGPWLALRDAVLIPMTTIPVALLATALDLRGALLIAELAALAVLQLAIFSAIGIVGWADAALLLGRRSAWERQVR